MEKEIKIRAKKEHAGGGWAKGDPSMGDGAGGGGGRALPPALTIFSVFCLGSPRRGLRGRPPAGPSDLFPLPNVGAGKRISFQPLPDEAEADRNRQRSLPD